MFIRYLSYILTGVVTVLFSSVLFYNNPSLANGQIISGYFFYQLIAVIGLGIALIASCMSREKFTCALPDYGMLVITILGMISGLTDGYQPPARLALLSSGYWALRVIYNRTPEALKIASLVILTAGIAECWLGLRQLYGFAASNHSIYKLTGSFFNPGPYSGYLAVILPLALYWMLKLSPEVNGFHFRQLRNILRSGEKTIHHLLFGISVLSFCGIIIVLPAGMSRSAWIASCVGCGLVMGQHYRLLEKLRQYYQVHRKRVYIYACIAVLLLAGMGTGMYLLKKGSADGRMLMWKISAKAIAENPWTGAGGGRFAGIFGQAQAAYFASGEGSEQEEWVAGSPEYGFNEYLQIGVEYGLLGLLLLLAIAGSAFWQAARSSRPGTNAVIGSLSALLVFALFSYPFRIMPLCTLGILLLALAVNRLPDSSGHRSLNIWVVRGTLLVLLGCSAWLVRDRKEKQEAYRRWAEEKTYFNMNIFEETVNNYRDLYPLLKTEPVFLFEYGQCLSKTGKYEESNRILSEGIQYSGDPMFYNIMGKNYQALEQYDRAEKAFRQAAYMVPHRLYPYYLKAKMYFESGQTEKALEAARQLIAKEPKVMSEAVREMKQELTDSLKSKENTLDINP